MRNLTKVLAMVLAFTMMVSVAGFAASYTDVASDANYAEAVSVLSDLGLVKGYEDGTFGADKTLTRAEAATLVVRLMGLEEAAVSAAGSATDFSDVPADHWASGYITVAASRGVVAGMGDGTFAPEAELEYAQIVKMIVVALGYEPQAAESGEWPTNYISTASNIGLTKGIPGKATDKVSRATTARLLYAALTIPKMTKTGVGVTATFEASDTLILDDLGIYKVYGTIDDVNAIEGTADVTITSQCLAYNKKYKELDITDKNCTFKPKATYEAGALVETLKGIRGIAVYMFITEVEGDETIVSVVESKDVSTLTITTEDIKEFDGDKLVYYTNAEQTKTASIKLAQKVENGVDTGAFTVYKNSVLQSVPNVTPVDRTFDISQLQNFIGTDALLIELKDAAKADGKYDYVNLTEFKYSIVKKIKVNNDGVYTFNSEALLVDSSKNKMGTFKIDTENEDTAITIIKDNAEISVEDIAVGDILNVVREDAKSDGSYDAEFTKGTIYVTNDTVEGVVNYVDDSESLVVFEDDSAYSFYAAGAITEADGANLSYDLKPAQEGTFYIDICGRIIYVGNENVTSSYKYGFATNVEFTTKGNFIKNGTLRILTTEGEWVTLDLRDTMRSGSTSQTLNKIAINDGGTAFTSFANAYFAGNKAIDNDNGTYDVPSIVMNQVVAYKLDAAGKVREVKKIDAADTDNKNTAATLMEYNADEDGAGSFDNRYEVDETTVVFNVAQGVTFTASNFDEDDVTVADISIFKDDKKETVTLINYNDDTYFVPVIYGQFEADIDFEGNYFVVSNVNKISVDDEIVTKLDGIENGEAVSYFYGVDNEATDVKVVGTETNGEGATVLGRTGANYTTFAKGDIMIITADANGYITKGVKLASVNDFATATAFTNVRDTNTYDKAVDGDDEGKMFGGFVALEGKGDGFYVKSAVVPNGTVTVATTEYYDFADAVVTVYDFTKTKDSAKVYAGDVVVGSVVFGRVNKYGDVMEAVIIVNEVTEKYDVEEA